MVVRAPSGLPQVAVDRVSANAEGPAWHPAEKRLYWVDPSSGVLRTFQPSSASVQVVAASDPVHHCAVQADGSLLLMMRDGRISTLRDGVREAACGAAPWGAGARIDAAACHPDGSVYCSARPAGEKAGALFRISAGCRAEKVLAGPSGASGIAFSRDGRAAYVCDRAARGVLRFKVEAGGALTDHQLIASLPESLGAPRGLALDSRGFLWIPMWGGSCVLRLSPAGKEEQRVYFMARLLSGITFGGEDGRDVYVTSCGGDNQAENGPAAGAVFRHRPGVRSAPQALSRVALGARDQGAEGSLP